MVAGTQATIAMEVLFHCIDTINVRSKVINGAKIYVFPLIKSEGISSLFKGITPVLYGYFPSSLIFFYTLGKLNMYIKESEEQSSSF